VSNKEKKRMTTTDLAPALQKTMTAIARLDGNLGATVVPLDQNPVAVYLARLGSVNGKIGNIITI
jgi:hypothetical protein